MRAYVKVCLGLQFLLDLRATPCLWFFEPGTKQEDAVAQEIAVALEQYPDAVASVSVECHGAMGAYPVIGEFPMLGFTEPRSEVRERPVVLSRRQREVLASMVDGASMCFVYRDKLVGKALLKRGLVEPVAGMPAGETWLVITDTGRVKLAELGAESGLVY
jgi:hypothetical protein